MTIAPEPYDLDELRAVLEDAPEVDASQVVLGVEDDAVVLGGSVASAEEVDRARLLLEQQGVPVVDRLQVDPALREGITEPVAGEPAVPAEDEVLVGQTDMLAGPEAAITDDVMRSLTENEPLQPADEPLFPPTRAEQRTRSAREPAPRTVEDDEQRPERR